MLRLHRVPEPPPRREPEASGPSVRSGGHDAESGPRVVRNPGASRRPFLLTAAAVVWLVGVPPSQRETGAQSATGDAEAVSVYRKMTAALRKAGSLELVCKARFKTDAFEANVSATLLTKNGDKIRMDVDIKGTKDGRPYSRSSCIVSNGMTLRVRENQEAWSEFVAAKKLNEAVLLNVTRGGFPTGLELDHVKPTEQNPLKIETVGFFPVPEPTDFVLWKKEDIGGRELLPVEFKLKSKDSAFFRENSVILWVDAKTFLPVKRLNVIQSDRTLTVTEDYETVSLNPSLDDSRFEAPRER